MGLRELLAEKANEHQARRLVLIQQELEKRLGAHYLSFVDRWSKTQRELLSSTEPFLFALGGNGAGKTTLGSWWLKSELDSFNPITGAIRERRHPVNVYAVANTTEKMYGVMQPAMKRWLPKDAMVHEDRQNNIWHLTEERRILWKTGEQDPTTFTGDEIDAAWIDEELKRRAHWDEILARLGRRLGRCLNTFTAAEGMLWMNNWIFSPDEYPMEEKKTCRVPTDENPYYHDCDHCGCPLSWHPKLRGEACADFSNAQGQAKLDRMRRQWRGLAYKIRFEGHAILMSGKPVFDPDIREKKEREHSRPPICGYLNEALHFVHCEDPEDPRAWLRIQVGMDRSGQKRPLIPQPGSKYLLGCDVGGGNPLGDYHAAVVIDEETGEQVALAHTRSVEPRDFGSFVAQLARFYNDAYCIIEANNHGIAVFDKLIELGYGNLYRRQRLDGLTKRMLTKNGFWTDMKTKPIAVDLMVSMFYDKMTIHDPILYGEMYHYTWLKEDRPGCHKVGNSNPDGHDDTMSALFCCCVGFKQLGHMIVGSKDRLPEPEVRKSIADALFEDASGRSLSAEEIMEGQDDSSLQEHVDDPPDDPYGDEPWVP